MWPFNKKKVFKITWKYCNYPSFAPSTEYVKASDIAEAWSKIRQLESAHTITLIDWEEIKNEMV